MDKPVLAVKIKRITYAEYLRLRDQRSLETLVKGMKRLMLELGNEAPIGSYWMDEDGTVYAPSGD